MLSTTKGFVAIVAMGLAFGRSGAATRTFDSVEIFTSAPNTLPGMRQAFAQSRYELRDATLVDLIRTAWDIPSQNVTGGPQWMDTERFDIVAGTQPGASPDALRSMLQKVLEDRFGLSLHTHSGTDLAYTMTVGSTVLAHPASASDPTGCVLQSSAPLPNPQGFTQPAVTLVCNNTTAAAFAQALAGLREGSGYLFDYPVLDRTALTGTWNFRLTWTSRNAWHPDPVTTDGTTLFEALEKQLGLKLTFSRIPGTLVVVDSASEPKTLPRPRTPTRFATADIRADDAHASTLPCGHIDIQPGGRVLINMTLRSMILETQGTSGSHEFIGDTRFLDAPCWRVQAQSPVPDDAQPGWSGVLWNGVDIGSMRVMLRGLLEDRFKLATHTEQRPINGFALVAATPTLKTAEPSNRSGCEEGPGVNGSNPDWKDPRFANPLASRLVTCRNVTLEQFAQELNQLMPGVGGPLVDRSGLPGRYDITINFSPDTTITRGRPGIIPFSEALKTQLGLELQPTRVPAPMLVIDHVEQQPLPATGPI
jgi:uncharacterized protein (TIGR03435 family)